MEEIFRGVFAGSSFGGTGLKRLARLHFAELLVYPGRRSTSGSA